jgi:hypothetical protein
MLRTDEEPVYRVVIYGGIYGLPFTLEFHGPAGMRKAPDRVKHRWHTQILAVQKGPYRDAVIRSYYEELGSLTE